MTVVRVLIVDDSLSVRAVLRRFLSRAPDLEVVGEAEDGAAAVEAAAALGPDVILMDLQMPVVDGYTAIERIMAHRPTPIVVLSSLANRDAMTTGFEAIRRGALEVLPKPEDPASWEQLAASLAATVRELAGAALAPARSAAMPAPSAGTRRAPAPPAALSPNDLRWIAVGASTGGPAALRELLAELPPDPPVTVLVVQHIAAGFELGFADWLARELRADVRLAQDGETPRAGAVRIARAGAHLLLEPDGALRLDAQRPPRAGHRPSIDELFLSCAASCPRQTAGVLLTGMGQDGAEGLLALRQAGGLTMAQDEASAVVFGMPRVALERGAAELALPPRELGRTLARAWQRVAV
ncbi:MAG TPA: chemotaxis-specific protein-glutamate methyltransferase CheB [Thermoanaerobaculia bacterium]